MIVAQKRSYHYSLPQESRQPVRRPRRKKMPGSGRLALIGLVLLGFCTGIMVAFFYAQMLTTGYHIYRLEKDLAALNQETQDLNEHIARLSSLERVEMVATTKLGMVKPDNHNVVLVKAEVDTAEPKGNNLASVSDGSEAGPESTAPAQRASAGEKSHNERNWVIQAFTDLVGQLEQKIRPS